ncbi:hypothetical protein COOONC_26540, partial [Cooperia oncophora]
TNYYTFSVTVVVWQKNFKKGNQRTKRAAQVCCLLVTANYTGRGNARRSAIQSKNVDNSHITNANVIAEVYNNDLLMRHIVSFVTDINR